jgi:hypothetical protein
MSWIQTFTGNPFDPSDLVPGDFDIRDIAHSLSLQCRFNGHCTTFYSVAEHSVRVSRVCPQDVALWGLLHDLGEAYVGDLPRPVKQEIPGFSEIEDRVLRIATEAFGLTWPMPDEVKRADDLLLVTEFRDLMGPGPGHGTFTLRPLAETIVPLTAPDAERAFLDRYFELVQP